eukprot:211521_1
MANDVSEKLTNEHHFMFSKRLVFKFSKHKEKFELYEWLKPTKLIGEGAYSAVCEATDCRNIYYNRKCAIKKHRDVFIHLGDARKTYKEIKLLMHFNHPCIISLCNVIPPSPSDRDTYRDIYLIMPKYDATLKKVIRSKHKLTERHIQYFAYQILRALEYIHSANIICYDLRPENILVKASNCQIILTDFTGCVSSDDSLDDLSRRSTTDSWPLCRWYIPPELFCNSKCKTPKIDIWSFACILAELYVRKPLFKGRNHIEQLQLMFHYLGTPTDLSWVVAADAKRWIAGIEVKQGKDMDCILPDSTEKAQEFVKHLLIMNPNKRPDASTVLKHEWLKVNDGDYKVCEKFVISEDMITKMNTAFGMRHIMYEELYNYNKNAFKKEMEENKWFALYCKIVIQGYFRQSNVQKRLKEQSIDLILIIMTQHDYIGDCKGLLRHVQKKIKSNNCNNKPMCSLLE